MGILNLKGVYGVYTVRKVFSLSNCALGIGPLKRLTILGPVRFSMEANGEFRPGSSHWLRSESESSELPGRALKLRARETAPKGLP